MKKNYLTLLFVLVLTGQLNAQTFGTFTSVRPGTQNDTLHIPSSHTFQMLIQTGDPLTGGGSLPANNDFTGYVPIGGASDNGYVSINHENTPGAVTILDMTYNYTTHLWEVNASNDVNTGVYSMRRNCSGGVTPWGTILTAEETTSSGDSNPSDGYQDVGWLTEIDPVTRSIVRKCWPIGRCAHENAVVASDNRTVYTGADNGSQGYVYKFIADSPTDLSSGTLYVLTKSSLLSSTGTWAVVPNTTQAQRNNTGSQASGVGARNFNGVEDIEISPIDGKIYFTSKSSDRVYRFTDNGTVGTGTDITDFEIFVGDGMTYNIDYGSGTQNEAWGNGNDNLTFDGEGNLYVLQDGDRDHIWMVKPTHTQASPDVELFLRSPAGSEPTGMTFTPDYNFAFVSMQHPSGSNSDTQIDATGSSVRFNASSTIVIARKEFLGPNATFPVEFGEIKAARSGSEVQLNWSTLSEASSDYFAIERSDKGYGFEEVGRVKAAGISAVPKDYRFNDSEAPGSKLYYRIRQVDYDGKSIYSNVVNVMSYEPRLVISGLYPNPAQDKINLDVDLPEGGSLQLQVLNIQGQVLEEKNFTLTKGAFTLEMSLEKLPAGAYFLNCQYGKEKETLQFIKK